MSLARSVKQYLGVRAILPPDLQTAKRNPTASDKAYVKGTLWLNLIGKSTWMWPGSGSWIPLGSVSQGSFIVGTGTGTLVAGTVTISDTRVLAGDVIQISRSALNASPALGSLISTISSGVSIAVTSYSAVGAAATTDVSGFTYSIVRAV